MTGKELKNVRKTLDISQGKLAAKLGVVWQTVQRWEHLGDKAIPVMAGLAVQQIVMQRYTTKKEK